MMGLIVISSQKTVPNEIEVVKQLFEAGMQVFHLRKPKFSRREMREYIATIPSKYHNRIVIHSHHDLVFKFNLQGIHFTSSHRKNKFKTQLRKWRYRRKRPYITFSTSFHKLINIDSYNVRYNYVFLSPIFDSITKKDYQSGFNHFSLKSALSQSKYDVYALGGVKPSRIDRIKEWGFKGAVLYGFIWTSENPVEAYIEFRDKLREAHGFSVDSEL